jgi:hypothetical protein
LVKGRDLARPSERSERFEPIVICMLAMLMVDYAFILNDLNAINIALVALNAPMKTTLSWAK